MTILYGRAINPTGLKLDNFTFISGRFGPNDRSFLFDDGEIYTLDEIRQAEAWLKAHELALEQ